MATAAPPPPPYISESAWVLFGYLKGKKGVNKKGVNDAEYCVLTML